MSETLFGDDSMDFKANFDNPRVVAEAYDLISNAYGEACNQGSKLKPFLKTVNSEVGSLQGSLDNISSSDIESYEYFPAEERNGHMVPAGFEVDPASDEKATNAKLILQRQLREHLATDEIQAAGNSEPEPAVEPESDDNESNDNNDTDTHPVCEIPGVGNGTAEKVATFFDSNPEAVSEILEAADSVQSFETAEVDRLAEVAGEERAEALRELFPDKSDEALIAFEQG